MESEQQLQDELEAVQWWDDEVEALLEKAARKFSGSPEEEAYAERCLSNARMLVDAAVDNLQHYALHNPCGDGEVLELAGGVEACAGCFNEDGSAKD